MATPEPSSSRFCTVELARLHFGLCRVELARLLFRPARKLQSSKLDSTKSRLAVFLAALSLWLCAFGAFAAAPQAAPGSDLRIAVMTMAPGELFWERFGHNAIVIDDPASPTAISYNFGFFDLDEPGFIGRFVAGEMRYALVALPLQEDLQTYRREGRGVTLQWLDLDPAQALAIKAALEENARPENSRYRYDYFTANCSTRVRDTVDRALGGLLQRRLSAGSHGNTYHSEASRLVKPALGMWLGFEIGFGPSADQPMSLWQEAYVPRRLADSLREVKRADGRPLVRYEEPLLPHLIAAEPDESQRPWWPYALAGLAIAGAILWAGRRRPRSVAALALPFWLACGLVGALLVYIWGFTAHWAGWRNANALLFNPLCLLLLPGGLRLLRARDTGDFFRYVLAAVATCAVVALFLHWLPVEPQQNLRWIVLLLPIHLALLLAWWPRRTLAAAA